MQGEKIYRYEDHKKTPYKTGIINFTRVAEYFQYFAPGIDSVHSAGKIEEKAAKAIFECMINSANMEYETVKVLKGGAWKKLHLDGENLDFSIPRMKFSRNRNEDNLHALLRHIRNALAHGRLYIVRKKKGNKNYVFLEDLISERITAKIMVSLTILERWKAILENEIPIGE